VGYLVKYQLVRDTIDSQDIEALCDWLKTNPRLSKGPLTVEFEKQWAEWLGTKHAVYVNSGSSANLLVLHALMEEGTLSVGDKVVVPAVSWATDLSPVMQLGLEPILCDCNLEDLSLDLDQFEQICLSQKPKAVMFVSVLGLVPNMSRLVELCKEHSVCLIEDACESFGSRFRNQKIGTFGRASTFSLYFGHHLSTIEGGIVATDDSDLYNVLLSTRSHGWSRDLEPAYKEKLKNEWGTDDFNELYTFYYSGLNLRATDLQAFIGLRQIKRADDVVAARERNFRRYIDNLSDSMWKPTVLSDHFVSNFCYPIICDNKEEVVQTLKENQIETRPLIAGSMAKQPFYIKRYGKSNLPNSEKIHNGGLYLPNNSKLQEKEIDFIISTVNKAAK
tara:strand:+ start:61 stop:1230 length:1170 start_codon:yes stop_codon:yes gene_type:complete